MYRTSLTQFLILIINLFFGFSVLALLTRFLLRLFGANPEAGFSRLIYSSTAPLLNPFQNIFSTYTIEPGNVIEFSTLLAILVYLFIAYLLMELIAYIGYYSRRTYYAETVTTTP